MSIRWILPFNDVRSNPWYWLWQFEESPLRTLPIDLSTTRIDGRWINIYKNYPLNSSIQLKSTPITLSKLSEEIFAKINEISSKRSPNNKVMQRLILWILQKIFRDVLWWLMLRGIFHSKIRNFIFSLRLKLGLKNTLDKWSTIIIEGFSLLPLKISGIKLFVVHYYELSTRYKMKFNNLVLSLGKPSENLIPSTRTLCCSVQISDI